MFSIKECLYHLTHMASYLVVKFTFSPEEKKYGQHMPKFQIVIFKYFFLKFIFLIKYERSSSDLQTLFLQEAFCFHRVVHWLEKHAWLLGKWNYALINV